MKLPTLILLLLAAGTAPAQRIEKFYTYNWKECDVSVARYYAIIEKKDSLWLRNDYYLREKKIQMTGKYRDSACQIKEGPFLYFHANGMVDAEGSYVNGKEDGQWVRYHNNGVVRDSVFYKAGKPLGLRLGWRRNGFPKDSSVYYQDGTAVKVEWFDNGTPSSAGRTLNDKLTGPWIFFHRNGHLSARESYRNDTLLRREYFDEDGKPLADTSNRDRDAEFPGGQNAFLAHLVRRLYVPDNYRFVGGDRATVVISCAIDESGKMCEAEVYSSFHPEFDRIAINAVKSSPKWKPAINHNRNVKQYFLQPITFQISDE